MALARVLGARSPGTMLAAMALACAPDVDVIPGLLLHGDPWRMHRKLTHRPAVVLGFGAVAGAVFARRAGVRGVGGATSFAAAAALVAGSHVLLDRLPVRYRYTRRGSPMPTRIANEAMNLTLDAAIYGAALMMTARGTAST